jgi:HPt (histidine-containing phosphotransfer) domain-containing protein
MVFDYETALKGLGHDESLLRETLQDFIDFYGNAGEKIHAALDEDRHADAGILAHTLKGLGGTFAADELADRARDLELSIRAGEVEGLDQKAADLDQAIAGMVADIRVVLTA